MSGPIIRKYGFPNFEKIFGERPLEHGVDDEEVASEKAEPAGSAQAVDKPAANKKKPRAKKG